MESTSEKDAQGDPPSVCDSCGWPDDEELQPVNRVFPRIENEKIVGGEVSSEIEFWCSACRTMYPHQAPAS